MRKTDGMEYADEVEDIYNDVIQEFDYLNSYRLNGDEVQTIVTDIVEYVLQIKYND